MTSLGPMACPWEVWGFRTYRRASPATVMVIPTQLVSFNFPHFDMIGAPHG